MAQVSAQSDAYGLSCDGTLIYRTKSRKEVVLSKDAVVELDFNAIARAPRFFHVAMQSVFKEKTGRDFRIKAGSAPKAAQRRYSEL